MNVDSRPPLFTRSDFLVGLSAFAISSALVLIAAWFGIVFVKPTALPVEPGYDFWFALDRWDGAYYRDIARDGYRYDPGKQGVVAFFPGYPLLIRAGVLVSGGRVEAVAVVVAHLMLAASFVLLHAYARLRIVVPALRAGTDPLVPSRSAGTTAGLAVLSFAVLPTTVFFRLGYSESTFFFLVVLFLLGLQRGWSWLVLALIAGAATGTRSVGVALVPVLLLELWRRELPPTLPSPRKAGGREKNHLPETSATSSTSEPVYPLPAFAEEEPSSNPPPPGFAGGGQGGGLRSFLPRAAIAVPLACWGLLAFMAYQWQAFGEPLAFAKIQKNWGGIGGEFEDTLVPLATYEPAWGTYDPSSRRYWKLAEFHDKAPFSIRILDPVFFTGTLLLALFGAWRGVLNGRELLLALILLGIPYFTRGYTGSMGSFGRFAAVVVPIYLLCGWLLARAPAWLIGLIASVCTFWLCVFAMMFTAGWQIT